MGWAGGSSLMNAIIEAVKAEVPDAAKRQRIYEPIYEAFRGEDWDTVDESMGLDPAFDAITGFESEDDEDEDSEGG